MARYKNGINGPLSGKVGPVVATSWRGVKVLRAAPTATDEMTEGQRIQRLKFKLVAEWLRPLRDLIWLGFKLFTGSKTPMNGCVGYHLKHAVSVGGTDCQIDFPKAIFSRGELVVSLIRELVSAAGALLNIKWDSALPSVLNSEDDEATFIVYSPKKKKFATFSRVAKRADGAIDLKLPAGFAGDEVHCYMQYVSADSSNVSTTIYAGTVVIG
ncbi:MAG TPA: DUF6266 family protein [Pedobacter sp.]|nr:DUF6266 family protein [Pedobacter sp.]